MIVAIAGHIWFWYLPRPRTDSVDPTSLTGRLLAADLAYRIWVPYPHQNVGALSGAVEDPEEWLAAAARLVGTSSAQLPRFGPFRFPPASALTVATDATGAQGAIAVDVFPSIAIVARLAGRIANNSVLSGGTVVVGGDELEIEWSGNTWLVTKGALDADALSGEAEALPDALAWLGLGVEDAPLPRGNYRLMADNQALVLSSHRPSPPGTLRAAPLVEELSLLFSEELAFVGVKDGGGRDESVLVGLTRDDDELRLPDAAALFVDESSRFALPGEDLARLLDIELRRGSEGRYGVVALTDRGLQGGLAAARTMTEGTPRDVEGLLWVRPEALLPLVEATLSFFESVPILGRNESRRWRDLATVLGPVFERDSMWLEIGRDGATTVVLEAAAD